MNATIYITDEFTWNLANEVAKHRGISRSQLVEEALATYMRGLKPDVRGKLEEIEELVKDLKKQF